MTCHYPDLGSPPDWLKQISLVTRPIRRTTQIWVVMRHEYGINPLVPQTLVWKGRERGFWARENRDAPLAFLSRLKLPFRRLSRRLLSNLVPMFSLLPPPPSPSLSLSRSVGTGRGEPWKRGWLLRRQFEGKPEVSQNVDCFLRLLFTQWCSTSYLNTKNGFSHIKQQKMTHCTGDYLHVERPEKNYSIGITGRHTWTSFI